MDKKARQDQIRKTLEETGPEDPSEWQYIESPAMYALYAWRDGYTITLWSRGLEPNFQEGHPDLQVLETMEAATWEDAMGYLGKKLDRIYAEGEDAVYKIEKK